MRTKLSLKTLFMSTVALGFALYGNGCDDDDDTGGGDERRY